MNIIQILLEFIFLIVQGILLFVFIYKNSKIKVTGIPENIKLCSGVFVYALLNILLIQIGLHESLYSLIINILYLFVYTVLFISRNNILYKLLISIIAISIQSFSKLCTSFLVSKAHMITVNFEQLKFQHLLLWAVANIINISIILLIIQLIMKITINRNYLLTKKERTVVTVVFTLSVIFLLTINSIISSSENYSLSILVLLAELEIIITDNVCFAIINYSNKTRIKTIKRKSINQQNELNKQYVDNVRIQYEETKRIQHDIKQNIAVLVSLLAEDKVDEAKSYLFKYSDLLSQTEKTVNTGNAFINALLNSKISLAKRNAINIKLVATNDFSGIDEIDICTLLGNLLDNAIEACQKCQNDKSIGCMISSDEAKIIIKVTNSVEGNINIEDGIIITSKNDKENHGYGIKTIKAITDKYNGSYLAKKNDGIFISQIILYR